VDWRKLSAWRRSSIGCRPSSPCPHHTRRRQWAWRASCSAGR
jgi:hypothetical protein